MSKGKFNVVEFKETLTRLALEYDVEVARVKQERKEETKSNKPIHSIPETNWWNSQDWGD